MKSKSEFMNVMLTIGKELHLSFINEEYDCAHNYQVRKLESIPYIQDTEY